MMIEQEILDSLGFKNYELVVAQNVRRIIVNDYNEANLSRATSINLKRDTDNLKDFI